MNIGRLKELKNLKVGEYFYYLPTQNLYLIEKIWDDGYYECIRYMYHYKEYFGPYRDLKEKSLVCQVYLCKNCEDSFNLRLELEKCECWIVENYKR